MDLKVTDGGSAAPAFTDAASPYLHHLLSTHPGPLPAKTVVNRMKTAARKLYRAATDESTVPDWFEELLNGLALANPTHSRVPAPTDYSTDAETDAATAYLTPAATPEKAVIVGIVDDVLPFAHERLTVGGRDARVASVWMPDLAPDTSAGVGVDLPFGKELRGAQISSLLAELGSDTMADEEALYRRSGAIDFTSGPSQRLSHGAGHGAGVAGLAAGMAPDDDGAASIPVIAAALPTAVSADTLGTLAPLHIALSFLFILHRARRLAHHINAASAPPVVINLSYGIVAGPKDGFGAVEKLIQTVSDLALPDLGEIRIVLPMGNHRLARLSGVYTADGTDTAHWMLRPDDETPSVLEVWGERRQNPAPPATAMKVKIRPQGASRWVTTTLTTHGTWQAVMLDGREIARAYLQYAVNDGGGREVVSLFAPPTRPEVTTDRYGLPGLWDIAVVADGGGPVNVRVQRDDALTGFGPRRGRQSVLIDDDPAYDLDGHIKGYDTETAGVLRIGTINAYAGADATVRVGGTIELTGETVAYSGLGLDDPVRPIEGDVRRPAETSDSLRGVPSIGNRSGSTRRYAGTSFAAPAVTRELALEALSRL